MGEYRDNRRFIKAMGVSSWRMFLGMSPREPLLSLDEILEKAEKVVPQPDLGCILRTTYIPYPSKDFCYSFQCVDRDHYLFTVEHHVLTLQPV